MTAYPIQAAMVALNEAVANLQQAKEHADLFPTAGNIGVVVLQADRVEQLRKRYNEACIHCGPEEA